MAKIVTGADRDRVTVNTLDVWNKIAELEQGKTNVNTELEKKADKTSVESLSSQMAQKANLDIFRPSAKHILSEIDYARNNASANTNDETRKPYVITLIGDSLFGYHVKDFIRYLKNNFGLNGLGFDKFLLANNVAISFTGITVVEDNASNLDEWGFCGRVHKGSTGATISYKPNAEFPFNDFRIFFLKRPTGGQFQYRIDGGSWVSVDTNDIAKSIGYVEVNYLNNKQNAHTTHQIEIQVTAGEVYLYGIQTFNNQRHGVIVNVISEGGTRISQWYDKLTYTNQFLNIVNPNKILVWLGANDGAAPGLDQNTFNTYYQQFTTGLAKNNKTDLICLTPPRRGQDSDPSKEDTVYLTNVTNYRDKILKIAKDNDFSVMDMLNIYPSREIEYGLGMCADVIHPSETGGNFNTLLMLDNLLPKLSSNLLNKYGSRMYGDLELMRGANLRQGNYNSQGAEVLSNVLFNLLEWKTADTNTTLMDVLTGGSKLRIFPQTGETSIISVSRSGVPTTTAWSLGLNGSNPVYNTTNAAHTFQIGGVDKFKVDPNDGIICSVPVQLPKYTTATRPAMTAAKEGSAIWDTTLKKPIYWNGSAWIDATGAAV